MKKFENKFQDEKKNEYFGMFVILFSVNVSTSPVNFQVEGLELQADIQLKKILVVSLPDFHETYLTREKYSLLHRHTLLMQSLFGSACVCKQ